MASSGEECAAWIARQDKSNRSSQGSDCGLAAVAVGCGRTVTSASLPSSGYTEATAPPIRRSASKAQPPSEPMQAIKDASCFRSYGLGDWPCIRPGCDIRAPRPASLFPTAGASDPFSTIQTTFLVFLFTPVSAIATTCALLVFPTKAQGGLANGSRIRGECGGVRRETCRAHRIMNRFFTIDCHCPARRQ